MIHPNGFPLANQNIKQLCIYFLELAREHGHGSVYTCAQNAAALGMRLFDSPSDKNEHPLSLSIGLIRIVDYLNSQGVIQPASDLKLIQCIAIRHWQEGTLNCPMPLLGQEAPKDSRWCCTAHEALDSIPWVLKPKWKDRFEDIPILTWMPC
jgi:hypothetical protein